MLILDIIKKYNLFTKKKFGQNFLTDTNLLKARVKDAEVCSEDIVVEMSTGLKDKNGNLIYEGDIVADGDVKRKVVWGGWYWNAKATCACPLDNITTRFVEIIGNIHEQAEQKD